MEKFNLWLETIENLQIQGPFLDKQNDVVIRKSGSLIWVATIPDVKAWTVPPKYTENNMVGWLLSEPYDDENHYVGTVNVHPDFQRQGISSKLHDEAFNYFKSKNIQFHSGMISPKNLLYWKKLESEQKAKQIKKDKFIRIS